MLIRYWMTKNVVAIDTDASMQDAVRLLRKNNIRRLPVMKRGKLVGIVTNLDISRESASQATMLAINELNYLIEKIRVKEIMTSKDIQTVSPTDTVEAAALKMLEKKIGGLPVMDNGKLVGIITESDIFEVLVSMTGVRQGGIQFAFDIIDKPGSVREVLDILRSYGGRIVSILTSYQRAEEGRRHVYIRMKDIDQYKLKSLKDELHKYHLMYIAD